MAQFPAPVEGIAITHFIVSRNVEPARRFYVEVLGGEAVLEMMACSPVVNPPMTLSGTSMFVPMASSCEPREQSMMAASGTTYTTSRLPCLHGQTTMHVRTVKEDRSRHQ